MVKNDKRLKIAQIVSTFPPYRGGMGNVAYHLTDSLSRLGYEVVVFTPKTKLSDVNMQSYFKIHKLLPQFKFGNSAIVLQLAYHLLKFDLVHLHYPFLGASLGVILAKLIRGKKIKFILHYHMDLVGQDWRSFVYKFYNWIFLSSLIKFSDYVITTSADYLKMSLLGKYYFKNEDKFEIIPNGVDLDYFKPRHKDSLLMTRYKLHDKKVILFVGGLDSAHYFKGVNYLLKAFERLKREDVKLIIVGEGNLKSVYEDMVDSSGLNHQVIFIGYVPDQELVKYYNLCDLLVLPSIDKSEAFGMVLLEAMACGKAVLASSLPGVRQVVEVNVNGRLFKPKDADNLASHLNRLLDDKNDLVNFGANGRKIVEKDYSWKTITETLLKIYQS
ncbi:MAG TPA: glycosyltransferase family 4 protein [Patescibacteria group bacterium]|nr:glycosyltransferase family 4 protein [Patescibacteria group bacterium]